MAAHRATAYKAMARRCGTQDARSKHFEKKRPFAPFRIASVPKAVFDNNDLNYAGQWRQDHKSNSVRRGRQPRVVRRFSVAACAIGSASSAGRAQCRWPFFAVRDRKAGSEHSLRSRHLTRPQLEPLTAPFPSQIKPDRRGSSQCADTTPKRVTR